MSRPDFRLLPAKWNCTRTALEKMGYDPLPFYEEPPESPLSRPDLAEEYPLTSEYRRTVYAFFSFGIQAPGNRYAGKAS